MMKRPAKTGPTTLRQRILAFVLALIVLSVLGSTLSLYRITEVNSLLDGINRVSVPLGRLFAQVQADVELFRREADRGLGSSHWSDAHWRPRPVPRWIHDVLNSEFTRIQELVRMDGAWAPADVRGRWQEWALELGRSFHSVETSSQDLLTALEKRDAEAAEKSYGLWMGAVEEWRRHLQSGVAEYERTFRQNFGMAETRVAELRTGLEMILVVVVTLSLLFLWLGERALRPLGELTNLARDIARRGLRKEDKALLPDFPLSRSDEVSALAREFHRMATALLEREKTVDVQKHRVIEQNRLLREMGALNENVLSSIPSILIVADLEGKITQANPVALRWLGTTADYLKGTRPSAWEKLAPFLTEPGPRAIAPTPLEGRIYGGQVYALQEARGWILVLDDLTEEMDLQERLRRAENLAAVGRMSAQVAHEVRNPLHSIGLEAEVASEMAARLGAQAVPVRQALQSILMSVDRLEKITENYLKMSRLSAGETREVDLGEVLETVLATYAPVCEAQGVRVDWKREPRSDLRVQGDRELLEQVLGNLFRNALQALEGAPAGAREVTWKIGNTEAGSVYARIEDSGPGIPKEIQEKLFTPFVTTRAQGTGLGLSFIKKVVEDHHGRIHHLKGSCFELTLPGSSVMECVAENEPVEGPSP